MLTHGKFGRFRVLHVVYFDQLLGAARNQELVETNLFWPFSTKFEKNMFFVHFQTYQWRKDNGTLVVLFYHPPVTFMECYVSN